MDVSAALFISHSISGFENPGPPWILGGVTLLSLFFFIWGLWPKARVMVQAAKENRMDRPIRRLGNTLVIALAQSKMFKDGPVGLMHALIFWGFLILLFRAFQFFLIGFFPGFQMILPGWDSVRHG